MTFNGDFIMSDSPNIPGLNNKYLQQWLQQQEAEQEGKQPVNKYSNEYRHSSQYNAAQDFFPSMPMSKDEFKHFMQNLLKLISTQIKQEQERAKKASDDLKKSEKGE